ncbi:MAG TPA: DUF5908 family protein [Chitinophagaceae bacterium]|jgi:hypothetical protein|nr:DUF5908 family protein [Chitinophagaceae bacterium]
MPVIINEIEVLVEVNNAAPGNDKTASSGAPVNKEEIIKECVEKVMDIINQKNER